MNVSLHLILHQVSSIEHPGSSTQYPASNPYLNRVMIRNARDFYGRKREVERLYARIGAPRPQSVSVTGERRIGKSSLLWFLMQAENASRYLPDPEQVIFIFLDFQENREMGTQDFCAALLTPLSKHLPDIHPDGGYDALLAAVQHLDSQGLKLIILLDEFETVTQNPNFDARFYAFLRSLANRYNVAYITSSHLPLQRLCHSKQIADSPFFNIFASLHLRGFTEAEARELITIPSQEAGIALEPHTDFLLELGGTYPFFLQIACSALFEYLQTGDTAAQASPSGVVQGHAPAYAGACLPVIGREEVEMNVLEEAEPHFLYIWERMELGSPSARKKKELGSPSARKKKELGSPSARKEKQVLRSIAEGKPVSLRERSTLRNLIQQGYVTEGPGGPRLFSSLFARWVEALSLEPSVTQGEYAPEAIVVIDICGSTRIANRYGAHRLRALYEELEGIALEVAGSFRDRYRRTTGDGLLITFHTVVDAVSASLEIQRRVQEHNAAADEPHRIPIRFSIHFGETLTDEGGRRYGDAINMAFRVESLESEDQPLPHHGYMLATEHVARELASMAGIQCRELGIFELEGFTGLHRIYQLLRETTEDHE